MDIDTLIGLAAAPALIPMLVGATKPLVRLISPRVCDDNIENGPWQLLAALYGALWLVALVQSGHAPEDIDNTWTAVLVGIALGLGSTLVRTAAVAGAEKVSPERHDPEPELEEPSGPRRSPTEPVPARYEPVRRSS